jgi:hypothetical protein
MIDFENIIPLSREERLRNKREKEIDKAFVLVVSGGVLQIR